MGEEAVKGCIRYPETTVTPIDIQTPTKTLTLYGMHLICLFSLFSLWLSNPEAKYKAHCASWHFGPG